MIIWMQSLVFRFKLLYYIIYVSSLNLLSGGLTIAMISFGRDFFTDTFLQTLLSCSIFFLI